MHFPWPFSGRVRHLLLPITLATSSGSVRLNLGDDVAHSPSRMQVLRVAGNGNDANWQWIWLQPMGSPQPLESSKAIL